MKTPVGRATRRFFGPMHSAAGLGLAGCLALALGGCAIGDAGTEDGAADLEHGALAATSVLSEEGADVPSGACDAGAWAGDYAIASQAEIDALSGYTAVTGALRIGPSDEPLDLSALACLTEVGGELAIAGNRQLLAVEGFNELRSTGRLRFTDNGPRHGLFVIDGFDKLRTVDGSLLLGNGKMRIDGFAELELVSGRLSIESSGRDVAIYGMGELSTVDEMFISDTGALVLEGLSDLERVEGNVTLRSAGPFDTSALIDLSHIGGDLWLDGDDLDEEVANVLDLPELKQLGGSLLVEDFESPLAIGAFAELETIGGSLIVRDMFSDFTIGSFAELEYIGGDFMFVELDGDMPSLIGFDELERVEGELRFDEMTIERLEGFSELEYVGGDFVLDELEDMEVFDAFAELEYVGGNFEFVDAESLGSEYSGFPELEYIGGSLEMSHNEGIDSLKLGDLEALRGERLIIRSNAQVSSCEIEALRAHLIANGFYGYSTIEDNGPCQ